MNAENEENEPKLIIDNDWKAQVQKEKEELAKKEAAAAVDAPATKESTEDQQAAGEAGGSEDSSKFPPPPPASFEMLVTMLASQALVSMGQVPNPMTGKPEPNKAYARHYIDTIAMLQEKAEGNMSPQEEQVVSQTLHQLRLLFVSM